MQNNSEPRTTQAIKLEEEKRFREEEQKRKIELAQRAAELEQERLLLTERTRLVELSSEISVALISKSKQGDLIEQCCKAMVKHLEIKFVCVWGLNEAGLQMRTGAGAMSELWESLKMADLEPLLLKKVVDTQRPYIISAGTEEGEQIGLNRRFRAFASYPLVVEEEVLGVLGLFAEEPLTYSTFQGLIASTNALALGIAHRRTDQQREELLILAQQAQQQAEQALNLRNAFLSSVTHDLKSPLTSIIGSTQLLQRRIEKQRPPEQEKYLQTLELISSSSKRMSTMIEDLLDLAKLQMGLALDLNREEGDLIKVVQRIALEHQQETRKHQIILQTGQLALPAYFDEARIERVLINLLSNAIKYSPKGGEIKLTVGREEGEQGARAVFSLQDQGIGIPAKDLPHIFEPFQRASNSEHKIQGTGIGLTSVAQIIEQHGGTISVSSIEGEGATFIVRLPLLNKEREEQK